MEEIVLNAIGFQLTYPPPTYFSDAWLCISHQENDQVLRHLVDYILELTLLDYDMLLHKPSTLGIAAVRLSWEILRKTEVLEEPWSHDAEQVSKCRIQIRALVQLACEGGETARIVQSKYSLPAFSNVANIAALRLDVLRGGRVNT
jgi:hypothetical protein